jgi:hypothetical protein
MYISQNPPNRTRRHVPPKRCVVGEKRNHKEGPLIDKTSEQKSVFFRFGNQAQSV